MEHLSRLGSNHKALLLIFDSVNFHDQSGRYNLFRFEEPWCKEEGSEDLIKLVWYHGYDFYSKVAQVQSQFPAVDFYTTNSIRRRIVHLEEALSILQVVVPNPSNMNNQRQLEVELHDLLEKEELMWSQRSYANWLKGVIVTPNIFTRRLPREEKETLLRGFRGLMVLGQCI